MIVSRWDGYRREWAAARPMGVTSMICNRFVHGDFVLLFGAETTRTRVTGYIL
jgi:hypothetical protein